MKINNFYKLAVTLGFLAILVSVFCSCGNKEIVIPQEDDYLVVFSDMLSPKAGFYYINEVGDRLCKPYSLKMQDLTCFNVSESMIILSGERKNNTLLFDKGITEPRKDFLFLNKADYSGVTAINHIDDSLLGIMNGGFSGGEYNTLLVKQSQTDSEIHQKILNTYPHSVFEINNVVICAGTHISTDGDTYAVISEYDYTNVFSHNYTKFEGFWQIINFEESYVCLAEDVSQSTNTIVQVNSQSFDIEKEIKIDDILKVIYEYNGKLYAVGNLGIYCIDLHNNDAVMRTDFKKSHHDESHLDYAYVLDGNVYAFFRKNEREKTQNGYYIYGEIYKINIESNSINKTFISNTDKYRMDTIFIIPCSFLLE